MGGGGHLRTGGVGCGVGGGRSNCMLGGQIEWVSTQLVATAVKEIPHWPAIHLAIIQACFSLSSRVLLVSNLRRSNWKCTVKRFFKSTVMLEPQCMRGRTSHTQKRATSYICNKSQMYIWTEAVFPLSECLQYIYCSHIHLDSPLYIWDLLQTQTHSFFGWDSVTSHAVVLNHLSSPIGFDLV